MLGAKKNSSSNFLYKGGGDVDHRSIRCPFFLYLKKIFLRVFKTNMTICKYKYFLEMNEFIYSFIPQKETNDVTLKKTNRLESPTNSTYTPNPSPLPLRVVCLHCVKFLAE